MRSYIFCLLVATIPLFTKAADTTIVNIRSVNVASNEINNFSLSIQLFLNLNGKSIDPDYWLDTTKRPGFELVYTGLTQPVRCKPRIQLAMVNASGGMSGVGLKISNINPDFLSFFQATGDSTIGVQFTSDITMQFTDGSFGKLPAATANAQLSQVTITSSQRSEYVGAVKNFFYYQNKSDFGIEPNNAGSNNSVYFLTMRVQNTYNFKKTATCKSPASKIYWNFDSRLSTNTGDSMNFIKFNPLNLQLSNYNNYASNLCIQVGNESDQLFWNKRVAINLKYSTIIPNLVNLVSAGSSRLRLKPIVNFGVKSYYDYSNRQPHFFSGQIFGNGYYYIPLLEQYAIIIEGNAFYDFSTQRNQSKKINGNYAVTIGAELPKTGFKAMFKYISGKTDINFQQGEVISLGLLMDFLNNKY